MLKVSGQVLSRAALEISQAPTIPLAVSLGAGACAWQTAAAKPSAITMEATRPDMRNPSHHRTRANAITAGACPPRPADLANLHERRCGPARTATWLRNRYGRRFGGQGVSATGVSGGLPAFQASRLSTTNWSILARVVTEPEPRCGNRTT